VTTEATMTATTTTIPTQTRTMGRRRRRRGGAVTSGGSVIGEVDMEYGGKGSQPAMEPALSRGAPETVATRRRRAVLAGHGGDQGEASAALTDPDPTVRAAALGALARLGALDIGVVQRALADPEPAVRRRACTVAGRSHDPARHPDLVAFLIAATVDPEPSVVEAAAWALGELGPHAAGAVLDALARLVRAHPSPACREAAVAALGAIGAPDSLAVVLTGLDDTPAIRRRSAVALAAFEDPRAQEGLRRCLTDRDWQVRQAAEDLLVEDRPAEP